MEFMSSNLHVPSMDLTRHTKILNKDERERKEEIKLCLAPRI